MLGLRPVIGGKVLAVSNTQFTIRELGDNAVEEGSARGTQGAEPARWANRSRIVITGVKNITP